MLSDLNKTTSLEVKKLDTLEVSLVRLGRSINSLPPSAWAEGGIAHDLQHDYDILIKKVNKLKEEITC